MSIKFTKDKQTKGVLVPSAALKICGLQDVEKFEIHVTGKLMTLLPGMMTAPELLRTIESRGFLIVKDGDDDRAGVAAHDFRVAGVGAGSV